MLKMDNIIYYYGELWFSIVLRILKVDNIIPLQRVVVPNSTPNAQSGQYYTTMEGWGSEPYSESKHILQVLSQHKELLNA